MSPGMDVAAWIRVTICLACLLRVFLPATWAQDASQCTLEAGSTQSEDIVLQCSFKIHVDSFIVEHRRKSPENETKQILISCSPCKVDGEYAKVIIPLFTENTGSVWRFRVLVAPETSGEYRCFGLNNNSSHDADCLAVTSHENDISASDAVPSGDASSQALFWLLLLFLVPVVAAATFFLLRRVLLRTLGAAVKASTPGASTTHDSSERSLYLLHRVRRTLCRRHDSDNDRHAQHAEKINLLRSPSDAATSAPPCHVHSGGDSQLADAAPAGGHCDNGSDQNSPEAGEAAEVSEDRSEVIYENIPRELGETWRDGRPVASVDVIDDRVDPRSSVVSAELREEVGTARDSQVWSIYSEVTDSIDV